MRGVWLSALVLMILSPFAPIALAGGYDLLKPRNILSGVELGEPPVEKIEKKLEAGEHEEIWYDFEGNPVRVLPRPVRAVTGITRAERIAGIEPGPDVLVEAGLVSDRHEGRRWLRPTHHYRPYFGSPFFGTGFHVHVVVK